MICASASVRPRYSTAVSCAYSPMSRLRSLHSIAMPDPGARAVVSDDGLTISLTVYTAAGDAVPVALLPVRAVALAGELIEAAVPKLNVIETKPTKRRGGDPHAEQRQRRDEAICALHKLTGEGQHVEPWAREWAQRIGRFQPVAVETDPARQLMQEIKETGLPVGRKRIGEIVAKR
jgi:hypothetical protein